MVASRVEELTPLGWDDFESASPFLSTPWLSAFAAAGGPATRYLLFRSLTDGRPIAKTLEQSLPVAEMQLGRVPSKWVAAVFGDDLRQFGQALISGPHGGHFLDTEAAADLLEAARAITGDPSRRHPWLAKDLPRGATMPPEWTPIRSLPDLVMPLDPTWRSEGDYLAALPSKYRRRARRARRRFVGLTTRLLDEEQAEGYGGEIDALYGRLLRRAPYAPWRAPAGYLPALRRAAGEECALRGYFDGGQLVGYSTLLLGGNQALAHFAAVDDAYNASHQLYLNLLFDLLTAAIERGAQRLSLGRTATTIKSSLGAEPAHLPSFATHDGALRKHLFGLLNAGALADEDSRAPVRRPFA